MAAIDHDLDAVAAAALVAVAEEFDVAVGNGVHKFSPDTIVIIVAVMAGHSHSKNGVASLAYVPAIQVFLFPLSLRLRH
jgi:hypothetical protein